MHNQRAKSERAKSEEEKSEEENQSGESDQLDGFGVRNFKGKNSILEQRTISGRTHGDLDYCGRMSAHCLLCGSIDFIRQTEHFYWCPNSRLHAPSFSLFSSSSSFILSLSLSGYLQSALSVRLIRFWVSLSLSLCQFRSLLAFSLARPAQWSHQKHKCAFKSHTADVHEVIFLKKNSLKWFPSNNLTHWNPVVHWRSPAVDS